MKLKRFGAASTSTARIAWQVALLGAIGAIIPACDPKAGENPFLSPTGGSIVVEATPKAIQLAQGATDTVTLRVTRVGFTGAVTFFANPPADLTMAWLPSERLESGQTTIRFTVTASQNATYDFDASGNVIPRKLAFLWFMEGGGQFGSSVDLTVVPSALAGITVSASPDLYIVEPGGTVQGTVTVARQGNYTGRVSLEVLDLPEGVSQTLTPTGTDSYQLRLVATSGAPTFDTPRPVRIRATGQGLTRTATTSISLGVSRPDFRVSVRSLGNVFAGTEGKFSITVERTGTFTGPVRLSLDPSPGLTATFDPQDVLDRNSTMTVRVAADAGLGPRTITVRGTPLASSGLQPRTGTEEFYVLAPSGTFSLSAPNVTLAQGGTSNGLVTIGRSSDFNGPITLTTLALNGTSTLPAGMQIDLPSPVTAGNAIITVRTTAATPLGTTRVRITGNAPGYQPVSTDFSVTVTAAPVPTTIDILRPINGTLQPSTSASLTVNSSLGLQTLVRDQNNNLLQGVPVTWSSSDESVATVSSSGVVEAKKAGTTRIIAQPTGNPNVRAELVLTVTASSVATTIAIRKLVNGVPQPTTAETITVNGFVNLVAEVRDQNGQILSDEHLWASTQPAVATVDSLGRVRGMAPGVTDIIVRPKSNPALTAAVRVTVTAPLSNVARIVIEPQNGEITAPATRQYRVLFYDGAGNRTTVESGGSLEFTAIDTSVATVNAATGLATGKKAGTTAILVRYRVNGTIVTQEAVSLKVNAPGTGTYGAVTLSTDGNNTREIRRGVTLRVQMVVVSPSNTPVTTGVPNPASALTASNNQVIISYLNDPQSQGLPQGYFYEIFVPQGVPVGTEFALRAAVPGATAEIIMRVIP